MSLGTGTAEKHFMMQLKNAVNSILYAAIAHSCTDGSNINRCALIQSLQEYLIGEPFNVYPSFYPALHLKSNLLHTYTKTEALYVGALELPLYGDDGLFVYKSEVDQGRILYIYGVYNATTGDLLGYNLSEQKKTEKNAFHDQVLNAAFIDSCFDSPLLKNRHADVLVEKLQGTLAPRPKPNPKPKPTPKPGLFLFSTPSPVSRRCSTAPRSISGANMPGALSKRSTLTKSSTLEVCTGINESSLSSMGQDPHTTVYPSQRPLPPSQDDFTSFSSIPANGLNSDPTLFLYNLGADTLYNTDQITQSNSLLFGLNLPNSRQMLPPPISSTTFGNSALSAFTKPTKLAQDEIDACSTAIQTIIDFNINELSKRDSGLTLDAVLSSLKSDSSVDGGTKYLLGNATATDVSSCDKIKRLCAIKIARPSQDRAVILYLSAISDASKKVIAYKLSNIDDSPDTPLKFKLKYEVLCDTIMESITGYSAAKSENKAMLEKRSPKKRKEKIEDCDSDPDYDPDSDPDSDPDYSPGSNNDVDCSKKRQPNRR